MVTEKMISLKDALAMLSFILRRCQFLTIEPHRTGIKHVPCWSRTSESKAYLTSREFKVHFIVV